MMLDGFNNEHGKKVSFFGTRYINKRFNAADNEMLFGDDFVVSRGNKCGIKNNMFRRPHPGPLPQEREKTFPHHAPLEREKTFPLP
jgi:hypothetical protein